MTLADLADQLDAHAARYAQAAAAEGPDAREWQTIADTYAHAAQLARQDTRP